jgi:hypothetical protein
VTALFATLAIAALLGPLLAWLAQREPPRPEESRASAASPREEAVRRVWPARGERIVATLGLVIAVALFAGLVFLLVTSQAP